MLQLEYNVDLNKFTSSTIRGLKMITSPRGRKEMQALIRGNQRAIIWHSLLYPCGR